MASVTVTIAQAQADLSVTKTASSNSLTLGQQQVFTVVLSNAGPNTVTNDIVVIDCLPTGFQYNFDNTYGDTNNRSYSPGTCWWTLSGGLPAFSSATLRITNIAAATGTWTNTASLMALPGVTDPNPNNNAASAVVTITPPQADLAITKTVNS